MWQWLHAALLKLKLMPHTEPPVTASERTPVIDRLDELNMRVHHLIRKHPEIYQKDLPEWIVTRVNRSRNYSLGFTGFKCSDGHGFWEGLAGQFLLAVHSDKKYVNGYPDSRARFYAITVPASQPVRYLPGDTFPDVPLGAKRKIIHYSDDTLLLMLRDAIERLCKFVIEQEQDRKPSEVA